MAPATLTAHSFHLFATVFAFATTVALLLPQTRLASQSGTGRPFSVSARLRWRFNNQKLRKGILSNSKFDNMGVPLSKQKKRLAQRSEEHTYELQSLMRISYAAFCLKKK